MCGSRSIRIRLEVNLLHFGEAFRKIAISSPFIQQCTPHHHMYYTVFPVVAAALIFFELTEDEREMVVYG